MQEEGNRDSLVKNRSDDKEGSDDLRLMKL
jgi:hypothetical protein